MSWIGQSEASHIANTPSDQHITWNRVTTARSPGAEPRAEAHDRDGVPGGEQADDQPDVGMGRPVRERDRGAGIRSVFDSMTVERGEHDEVEARSRRSTPMMKKRRNTGWSVRRCMYHDATRKNFTRP